MEQRGLKISRMKTQYLGCNEHQDAEIHLHGETVKGVHSHTWDRRWRMMENWMRKSPAECRVQGGCNNWQRVYVVLCHRRMKVKINGKVTDSGKTSAGVRGRDMGVEEGIGK